MILFLVFSAHAVYGSYTDLRHRKISNALLLSGLSTEAAVWFCTDRVFGPAHAYNAALCAVLAIAAWKGSVWAAGDAKFFIFAGISCAFFAPAALESSVRAQVPLALILLCNALILAFCFIFLEGLMHMLIRFTRRRRSQGVARARVRDTAGRLLRTYGRVYFSYLSAFVFFPLISNLVRIPLEHARLSRLIFFVLLYALYYPLSRYSAKIPLPLLAALVAAGLVFSQADTVATIRQSFLFFLFVTTANAVVSRRLGPAEHITVSRDRITPGLMVAREEVERIDPGVRGSSGVRASPDGLTAEQAGWWKTHLAASGRQTLQAYSTFPFVPFITLAAALAFAVGARPITLFSFLTW